MNIELSKIKASPKPIRSTWDEDKLNELAQSIEEQGLIVPIKVRPANKHAEVLSSFIDKHGDGGYTDSANFVELAGDFPDPLYEIVYGHRRLEAMRIAGIEETDAIIEGVDDTDALIQSLIENVQREDMTVKDLSQAKKSLQIATGWSDGEIARRGILAAYKIAQLNKVLGFQGDWQDRIVESPGGKRPKGTVSLDHIQEISQIDLDNQTRDAVLEKASGDEMLTPAQTRQVAESVAATKDPKMRERLIDAPYSPYTHDPEYARERADRHGEHDPMARDKTPPLDDAWKLTAEVSMIVDFIKKSRQMYEEIIKMDELGKFSPEARPFLVGKLKSTIKQIQKTIDRLEA